MSCAAKRALRRGPAYGFTMIELLAVVMIIALLVGLLLPAVQSAREAARRQSCANNLVQIGLATEAYHQTYRMLPAGTISQVLPVEHYPNGYHHSWLVRILPMLGQQPLVEQVDWSSSCYDPANWPVAVQPLNVFSCPSDYIDAAQSVAVSNYAGVFDGRAEPLSDDSRGLLIANRFLTRDDVKDGFSYTLLAGDKTLRGKAESDFGWMSGTRSTLRTTGYAPRQPLEWLAPSQAGDAELLHLATPATVDRPYGNYLGDAAYQTVKEDGSASAPEDAEEEAPGGYGDDALGGYGDGALGGYGGYGGGREAVLTRFPAPPPPAERTQPGGFDSRHTAGLNMLWADGRVDFVNDQVDRQIFSQMGMRDDGMPLRPLQ